MNVYVNSIFIIATIHICATFFPCMTRFTSVVLFDVYQFNFLIVSFMHAHVYIFLAEAPTRIHATSVVSRVWHIIDIEEAYK